MGLYEVRGDGDRLEIFDARNFAEDQLEEHLETWLERNDHILFEGERLLWIGRQVFTDFGTIADVVGLDRDGCVVITELKRDRVAREAIAQLLEYGAWFSRLNYDLLADLAANYFADRGDDLVDLASKHAEHFALDEPLRVWNRSQRLVLIAQRADEQLMETLRYLRARGVDIHLLQFGYFKTREGSRLLQTEMPVGQEELGAALDQARGTAPPDPDARRRNREIVHRLVEQLNQDHAPTLQKFVHPFQLYQGRSDQGATAYVDFMLGDQKMAVDCWVDENSLTIIVFPRSQKVRQMLIDWWNSSTSLTALGFSVDTEKERPITKAIPLPPDRDPVDQVLPHVSGLVQGLGKVLGEG